MRSEGVEPPRGSTAFHAGAVAFLVLLGAAIYSNTLASPFVYDDRPNIADNEWIRIADLPPTIPTSDRPPVLESELSS